MARFVYCLSPLHKNKPPKIMIIFVIFLEVIFLCKICFRKVIDTRFLKTRDFVTSLSALIILIQTRLLSTF